MKSILFLSLSISVSLGSIITSAQFAPVTTANPASLNAANLAVDTSFSSSTLCIATQKLKACLSDALAADLGAGFAVNFARSFDEAMTVSHIDGANCLQEEIVEDLSKKLLLLYEASISVTQDSVSRDIDRVVNQLYH